MHATCLLLLAAVVGQPSESPPFAKNVPAMMNYYRKPDPELGPKWLKELLQKENIENPKLTANEHFLRIIGNALGEVAFGRPKIARQYEELFAGAAPLGKRVIIRALMICGDKETATKVDEWLKDEKAGAKPELEALKKHLADAKRKRVRDAAAKDPDALDYLWVDFFTTGEYAPIARILDVFDDANSSETMKRVAKWSLGANLQQHPKLVEVIEKNAKDRPAASKKVIDELIIKQP